MVSARILDFRQGTGGLGCISQVPFERFTNPVIYRVGDAPG
jgi:hypothetical protein